MTSTPDPARVRGPVEDLPWPAELTAHVVLPGACPRVHGYDVQRDLARNFRFGEFVLIALAGVAPTEEVGRAFEIAMTFAAPCSVAEAPAHAASVARLCGADAAGVLSTGAIAAAQQARAVLDAHRELLTWLRDGSGSMPAAFAAEAPEEREAVERLLAALGPTGVRPAAVVGGAGLMASVLAVLHVCGLRSDDQLAAALLIARLPTIAAEGFAARVGDFRGYPTNLPPFDYVSSAT